MSEHGQPEGAAAVPPTGLAKAAESIDAFIKPIYTWLGYLGAALVGRFGLDHVLVDTRAPLLQRAPAGVHRDHPTGPGVHRRLWSSAIEHMGRHEKMTVDILVKHLPRPGCRRIIAPFIYLLGIIIFCVVCLAAGRAG